MKLKMNLGQKLHTIFRGKTEKQAIVSEIEELLITADFGIEFTAEIRDELWKKMSLSIEEDHTDLIKAIIKERMASSGLPERGDGLNAYLIFGVNGSGKTTTVGKLAYKLKNRGNNVLIAAADTYRDAAIDQLLIWSTRADVPVVRQFQGSDPGAVVYDACDAALSRNAKALVIDTAGRLHTKERLMEELAKIGRILDRKLPDARRLKLLVIDATTGQNALSQASLFNEYIGVDGIILTKLDSSAKGGIACAISGKLQIPIIYAGIGEKMEDLIDFDIDEYLNMLFS
jgi:fused signal recognition particle receptor